ncbi:regulator of G-protein signaling 19-like isoform X1 [Anguilla rostrata]|uniref:regulator of G-protein signaling 19-like isoform X1 n=2 Tax=Anguilla rostrata TaxID=7938 RepID=UPI0030D347BE
MCFRKRNCYRPPDHFSAKIYTGPVPSEQDSVMVQSEAPPQSLAPPLPPPTQRPSSCCFCWCCCCSCSWYGLPPRQACCRSEEERRVRRKRWETKLETLSNCEACSKPSAEEMRLWAESFECLMRNPAGRNLFREFLRTEYSEDNMLFWLACEDLRQEHSKTAILEKAQLVYENYVSILSPKEVSLDSRVREVINQRMQDPTAHTFDEAQLQIYTLMHRDSYPRFLSSSVYRSLLRNGSCSSSLS